MAAPHTALLLAADAPADLDAHGRYLVAAGYAVETCALAELSERDATEGRLVVGLVAPEAPAELGSALDRALAAGADAAIVWTEDPADLLEELQLLAEIHAPDACSEL